MSNNKIKSPAFFGKKAGDFNLNDIEKGIDDILWCVILKNNRHVWVKKTKDLEEIHQQINNNTINNNNDIKTEKKCKKKKKYTQYNEYLEIKMKELKESNKDISPKDLFTFAVKEWHIIKNDKEKLNNYLNKN